MTQNHNSNIHYSTFISPTPGICYATPAAVQRFRLFSLLLLCHMCTDTQPDSTLSGLRSHRYVCKVVKKILDNLYRVAAYIITLLFLVRTQFLSGVVQETKINLCYMFLYFLKNTNMDTIKICKPITTGTSI